MSAKIFLLETKNRLNPSLGFQPIFMKGAQFSMDSKKRVKLYEAKV